MTDKRETRRRRAVGSRTRGRPTRVDRLPAQLRAYIDTAVASGLTQRDILDHINREQAHAGRRPISYSGLNRYVLRRVSDLGAVPEELSLIAADQKRIILLLERLVELLEGRS